MTEQPSEGPAEGAAAADPQAADLKAGKRALARFDRLLDRMARKKRRTPLRQAIKIVLILFVGLPLAWVLAYRFIEAPGTLLMVQRSLGGETIRRDVVAIENISPHLVRAVLAAEDSRFCRHDGFDMEAIEAAFQSNRTSKRMRGGSTISQQTAKNLFLWPQRSWLRKGLEVYFTGVMEFLWPKKRIMEAYLNAAEWGDGIFGAEAAARARFGVSAADLSAAQAARLAAVLPSPNKWNAAEPGPYVRKRANLIQARMRVIRGEGLDLCVLDPGAAPRPARERRQAPQGPLVAEGAGPPITTEQELSLKVDEALPPPPVFEVAPAEAPPPETPEILIEPSGAGDPPPAPAFELAPPAQ